MLVAKIVTLIRETSSSLPPDVLKALRSALRKERKGSSAAVVLKTILDNCALAKARGTPLCQDTGTLTFFVDELVSRINCTNFSTTDRDIDEISWTT